MRIWSLRKGHNFVSVFRSVFLLVSALIFTLAGFLTAIEPLQAHNVPNQTYNILACQQYNIPLVVTNAQGTISWAASNLPAWVTLSTNGIISGTPPASLTGTSYSFKVQCTDSKPVPHTLVPPTITLVIGPPVAMAYTQTYIPNAEENIPFYVTLGIAGGSGTFTWTANGLPSGLIIDNSGNISGTPPVGTANSYNITVTTTDTCSGQTINGSFVLVVAPGSYKVTVSIGSGLSGYKAAIYIDEKEMGQIAGGESRDFKAQLGTSHTVRVQDTVEGPNQTRFIAKVNEKSVSESNPLADFDYTTAVNIIVNSSPQGIGNLTGNGWYAIGELLTVSATGTVDDINNPGVQYRFKGWTLPNGETMGIANLSVTVSASGTFTANYETYYLLSLKSSDPMVDKTSWHATASTAEYSIDQKEVPMSGIWGFLGGFKKAVNPEGTHLMEGPYTVDITWVDNYTTPIIIITVITLLVIGLVIFFIWHRKRSKGGSATAPSLPQQQQQAQTQVTTPAPTSVPATSTVTPSPTKEDEPTTSAIEPEKPAPPTKAAPSVAPAAVTDTKGRPKKTKTSLQAEPVKKSRFCPNCGDPIEENEKFCDKCGKKLGQGDTTPGAS